MCVVHLPCPSPTSCEHPGHEQALRGPAGIVFTLSGFRVGLGMAGVGIPWGGVGYAHGWAWCASLVGHRLGHRCRCRVALRLRLGVCASGLGCRFGWGIGYAGTGWVRWWPVAGPAAWWCLPGCAAWLVPGFLLRWWPMGASWSSRVRTCGLPINSRLLFQLSYAHRRSPLARRFDTSSTASYSVVGTIQGSSSRQVLPLLHFQVAAAGPGWRGADRF